MATPSRQLYEIEKNTEEEKGVGKGEFGGKKTTVWGEGWQERMEIYVMFPTVSAICAVRKSGSPKCPQTQSFLLKVLQHSRDEIYLSRYLIIR